MTIIIVSHNEKECLNVCLKTIKSSGFQGQIIVADNNSEDGTYEWLNGVEGISIAYFDDETLNYARIINTVVKELEVEDDFLVVQAAYMTTPMAIEKLYDVLVQDEVIALVGGVSNGYAKEDAGCEFNDYNEAVEYSLKYGEACSYTRELSLGDGAVLFKRDVFMELGGLDETINTIELTMVDYRLRLTMADKQIARCNESIWFALKRRNSSDAFLENSPADYKYMGKKWKLTYFNIKCRENISDFMVHEPDEAISLLEVGCDCGGTLLGIKNKYKNAEVYGLELNPNSARIAAHVANVSVGNIEDKNLNFPKESFDYIVFGDVLEHLRDPEAVLVYCRELLKPGGYIIASIPNLMHVSVMVGLLNGDFTYRESGLLDKTHIHLFTYNEIVKMFSRAEYDLELIGHVMLSLSDAESKYIDLMLSIAPKAERFMYESFQYMVRAKK